jgi:hypothetical protein
MVSHTRGFWVVPTLGRAGTILPRLLQSVIDTGCTTKGVVVVTRSDWDANVQAYAALTLPARWQVMIVPDGCTRTSTMEAFKQFFTDDIEWMGWLADDSVCETQGWDTRLIDQLTGWNIVSTNDGLNAPKKANGAVAWSAPVLRTYGGPYPFGYDFKHHFMDDMIEALGKHTGCWQVDMDIMVRHLHAIRGGLNDSTTSKAKTFLQGDIAEFDKWQQEAMIPAAERILALMEKAGIKMVRPDLSDVRLMIASPAGDGKFDRIYLRALMDTEKLLTQFGATVHIADMSYCSDVTVARNRLFTSFLSRDGDTHMLSIDSDQGWKPMDVVRLLMAKRDFVAVAGIRKVAIESYAVNCTDDFGNPKPIILDPETQFLEVSEVGGAFTLISKACAVRMAQHYADLQYVNADGIVETALYNPMVVNRRYLGEDYAFCYRWRQTGGKILVAASIGLTHSGTFVWEGAWSNLLNQIMQRNVA